jgi:5-(carboxyamino)imidazole ribonucleotide synthase
MFAVAAARHGYRVHVFAPEADSPAAEVSAEHTQAAYDDLEAVTAFAKSVDAITYEFENVPAETVDAAAGFAPVRPQGQVLAVTRNRLDEKTFLRDNGIPVAGFRAVHSANELAQACAELGGSTIVKTTTLGYDGKGQTKVDSPAHAKAAWQAIGSPSEAIAEAIIPFNSECSMLVARSADGTTVCTGPFHNDHANHILDVTTWRADDDSTIASEANRWACAVADALKLTGMICIEFFVAPDGLLVNEIAPRPHNSGHLTIEAVSVSQYDQQVRLTAGHPPATPTPRAPAAAMVNLLGHIWGNCEPNWSAVLDDPRISLHLYGKTPPKPGRKMGHLTALADTPEAAAQLLLEARERL